MQDDVNEQETTPKVQDDVNKRQTTPHSTHRYNLRIKSTKHYGKLADFDEEDPSSFNEAMSRSDCD